MRQTKAKVKARNSVKRKRVRSKSNKPGKRTKRKVKVGGNNVDYTRELDEVFSLVEYEIQNKKAKLAELEKELEEFKTEINSAKETINGLSQEEKDKKIAELLIKQNSLIEKINK
tara:strand:+ start:73 stop:417 length:345 start_codon:yes stop_codon:yes gene_type:complete